MIYFSKGQGKDKQRTRIGSLKSASSVCVKRVSFTFPLEKSFINCSVLNHLSCCPTFKRFFHSRALLVVLFWVGFTKEVEQSG